MAAVSAQIFGLQGVILRGGRRKVGKVKTGLVLRGRSGAWPGGILLGGLHEVGEQRNRGQRKAGVHQAGQLRDGAAGQSEGRVAQSPLVQVDSVEGAETVDAGHVVSRQMQPVGGLKEGVVCQLQRGMKGHWCWKCLTAHD